MSSTSGTGHPTRIPSFYNQVQDLPMRTNGRGVQIFNESLEEFLSDSYQVARETLEQRNKYQCRSIGRVKVKSYCFVAPVPIINTFGSGRRRRRSSEPNSGLRLVAGIAGAVCGGYALFKLGQSFTHIRQAGEELNALSEFRGKLNHWNDEWNVLHRDQGRNKILEKVYKIAECKENIFSRIRRKAHLDVALLVGVIASAAFAIMGAIIASWTMLTASLCLGLTVGGAMLFKWGFDSVAKGHDKDSKEIKQHIQDIWEMRPKDIK